MEAVQAGTLPHTGILPGLSLAGIEPPVNQAVVYVKGAEIPYLRAGSGSPVLLIQTGADGTFASRSLLASLATRFRAIAPAAAHGPLAFSSWLRGFMDGLGLQRASLVATSSLGVACLGFALAEPERVERLVFLLRDAPDPVLPDGALPDRLSESGHPLLLVRTEHAACEADAAEEAILHFLGAAGAAAAT